MVKLILLLILFGTQVCMAQDLPEKLQVSVTAGYRQQNLQWSIAGNSNGQNPNILSELRWKKVGGPASGMHLQVALFGRWQLEGDYVHSFFASGKVYDTDYSGNDRTNPVYAEQFSAGKGGADQVGIGLGYRIPVTNKFSITLSAGYGLFRQSFHIYGNTVTFAALNSTYKTTWKGPYGQLLGAMALTKKLSLNTGFRYNQVQYRASANWNLINTFSHPESFRHTANGYGINVHSSVLYRISNIHSIGITGSYSNWQTGRGIDELYLATGEPEQTQLNEIRSAAWQVMVEWRISLKCKRRFPAI